MYLICRYKNFKCDAHNRFFEVNLYQKNPTNKHHWRAGLARPSTDIDLSYRQKKEVVKPSIKVEASKQEDRPASPEPSASSSKLPSAPLQVQEASYEVLNSDCRRLLLNLATGSANRHCKSKVSSSIPTSSSREKPRAKPPSIPAFS